MLNQSHPFYTYIPYIGWSKKSGTTFSGAKTACKNFTKLHTTFYQHVFNHFVNFQTKCTTNVEMTVALKLGVEKSNIVDTSNIGCVWHALCMIYFWNKVAPGLSLGPICHNYRLRYNLNRCIAQLSSCSDFNFQQTGFAQKGLPVVALITMALISTRSFHSVSSKSIGETVNSCINDLEIKSHTLKEDIFIISLRESVLKVFL